MKYLIRFVLTHLITDLKKRLKKAEKEFSMFDTSKPLTGLGPSWYATVDLRVRKLRAELAVFKDYRRYYSK